MLRVIVSYMACRALSSLFLPYVFYEKWKLSVFFYTRTKRKNLNFHFSWKKVFLKNCKKLYEFKNIHVINIEPQIAKIWPPIQKLGIMQGQMKFSPTSSLRVCYDKPRPYIDQSMLILNGHGYFILEKHPYEVLFVSDFLAPCQGQAPLCRPPPWPRASSDIRTLPYLDNEKLNSAWPLDLIPYVPLSVTSPLAEISGRAVNIGLLTDIRRTLITETLWCKLIY